MNTFSFIIPVYNCQNYIRKCVDTIIKMNQFSDAGFEIILVDDGSTDQSGKILDELKSKYDSIIRVVHQSNAGVSAARNRGIECSSGEYLVFIDADDEIHAEKMAELIDKLKNDSKIDMAVYGLEYEIIRNGKTESISYLYPSMTGLFCNREWKEHLLELYRSNALSSIWSRIIKKSIVTEYNIRFDESMISFEDLEFTLRVLTHCHVVCFVHELIYGYKVRIDDGKYQRRMDRIAHITDVTDPIEKSLYLIKKDEETDRILLSIYALLLKDKKVGKNKQYISELYSEFRLWVDAHNLLPLVSKNRNLLLCYNNRYKTIKMRDYYYAVRHCVALRVKKVFRKR